MSSKVAAELQALADKTGMIHVRKAHDWASKHRKSALGRKLMWDDRKAGYQYRLEQIRGLIQLHIIDARHARTYLSLSIDRAAGGGYRPVDQIMSNADLRTIALDDALNALDHVSREYQTLAELAPVWSAVARVRASRTTKDAA